MSVNLFGFGHVESATVSSNKTLTLADCGVVQNVTADATITLPATSARASFMIRVGENDITVNVSPNSSDNIVGNGEGTGADDKDLILDGQPAGSYVILDGDGTAGYTVSAVSGTATFES